MQPSTRRVLAVSGSLRAKSVNTAILLAAQSIAPAGVEVTLYRGLGDLPHFNPDLDIEPPPRAVAEWREAVRTADVLLLCTPEYAHGLPGSFKNALDWLVSFEGFLNKPVALINPKAEDSHAQASLREILKTMNARLLPNARVALPLTSNQHDAASLLANPDIRGHLQRCLAALNENE
jgi:chromate reductase